MPSLSCPKSGEEGYLELADFHFRPILREGARATPTALSFNENDVMSTVAGKIARSQRFSAVDSVILGSDIISEGFSDKESGGNLLSGTFDSKTAGILLFRNLKDLMEHRISMVWIRPVGQKWPALCLIICVGLFMMSLQCHREDLPCCLYPRIMMLVRFQHCEVQEKRLG